MEWVFSLFLSLSSVTASRLVLVLLTHDYCMHVNHHRGAGFWVLTIWGWTGQQQSCKRGRDRQLVV